MIYHAIRAIYFVIVFNCSGTNPTVVLFEQNYFSHLTSTAEGECLT